MTPTPHNPGTWPRLMRAETAAGYVDEESVEAFRRKVGTLYPLPINTEGSRQKWLRDDLDTAIERMAGRVSTSFDAVSVP